MCITLDEFDTWLSTIHNFNNSLVPLITAFINITLQIFKQIKSMVDNINYKYVLLQLCIKSRRQYTQIIILTTVQYNVISCKEKKKTVFDGSVMSTKDSIVCDDVTLLKRCWFLVYKNLHSHDVTAIIVTSSNKNQSIIFSPPSQGELWESIYLLLDISALWKTAAKHIIDCT